MRDVLLIYATAWGWVRFLPEPLRKRIGMRVFRALMGARGFGVADYSDDEIESGLRTYVAHVTEPSLDHAASIRAIVSDTGRPR